MTDENKFQRVEWEGDLFHATDDEAPFPLRPPSNGIPADDLELLTLAARAIGAQVEIVEGEDWVNLHFADGKIIYAWNSLRHSSDAFELLVALRLDFVHGLDEVAVNDQHVVLVNYVEYGPDPDADARRAVTRAAAEIGKAMV
jgi:hypothetical protein